MTYQTLIEPIIKRAAETPQHPTLTFIAQNGTETLVTAQQFHQSASIYAQALAQIGVKEDDLVILVLKHSEVLLSAFWGALYLGATPSIFPFLTEKLDPALYKERIKILVTHSGTKVVITYPEFKDELTLVLADVDCRVLSTEDVPEQTEGDLPEWSETGGEHIAFLQHSSGTTGLQKGVALSHRAVLNQIEAYSESIDLRKDDIVVSWLPLYHDMGLIAGFVMPIVTGTPLILMSPFQWVRDPKILLWAIHNHKATLAWLPNFAYNHLARTARPSYLEGLDLSSWRLVINCSEPVYHQSHEAFANKFEPYGFDRKALTVSYAMAENTFAVTQTPPETPPNVDWVGIDAVQRERMATPMVPESEGSMSVVSCGYPIAGTTVRILGEAGEALPERHVGEIVIQSNCMLTEYHNRPELTAKAMRDGWYSTGDMGYIAAGEVYISGRQKDLIIVGGKNIYPQDLEAVANGIAGIHPGRAVAFGMREDRIGSEVVVIVAELQQGASAIDPAEVERNLRQQIVKETEVTLADVRLLNDRWVIKTSSGKMARNDNRNKYLKEFRNG